MAVRCFLMFFKSLNSFPEQWEKYTHFIWERGISFPLYIYMLMGLQVMEYLGFFLRAWLSIPGHPETFLSRPSALWSPHGSPASHMCTWVHIHQTTSLSSWSCRKTLVLSPFFDLGGTSGNSRAGPLGPPERASSPYLTIFQSLLWGLTGLQNAEDRWGAGHTKALGQIF